MSKTVYVYHDADHGEIEVFTTAKAAKANLPSHYDDDEWIGSNDEGWSYGEYITIEKRQLNVKSGS